MIICSTYLVIELFIRCTPIGELPRQDREEKHAHRPNVSRWATVLGLQHDLRSHIRWSTAENLDLFLVGNASREAEVNDLHLLVVVKEQVF